MAVVAAEALEATAVDAVEVAHREAGEKVARGQARAVAVAPMPGAAGLAAPTATLVPRGTGAATRVTRTAAAVEVVGMARAASTNCGAAAETGALVAWA